MIGTPASTFVASTLKFLECVRVVDDAGYGHDVHAVLEQNVTHKREVGGRGLRGHLLVVGDKPAVGVDSRTYSVHRHGAITTALELLLSRCLYLDRVTPPECFGDLHGLIGGIIRPAAVVEPEGSAGVGDVHPDALLLDAGHPSARHLGVHR